MKPPARSHAPRASRRRDALETQARLFDAAGRLFAARGYEGANLRDICRAAGVNLAAVRHHFGSKEGLYRAVVVRSQQGLLEQSPFPPMDDLRDPAAALGVAIEHMLRIMLIRRAGHPYAGQLMARELRAPTAALDDVHKLVMTPVRTMLGNIVGALLGPADAPALRGHATNFVIGVCFFHEMAQEPLKRFGFPPPKRDADIPALAEQITTFALGGIARLRRGAIKKPTDER